ncbi:MAG: PIG-L family deacetylase [Muribaculaceae bacterium]|nr:PIG-L family deacetylase [Muribaculaceae bacterium]
MKYLIVVAHPDDEVLGAGASIYKWSHEGHVVDVCIMCSEAKARAFRPNDSDLSADLNSSAAYIGIKNRYEYTFPNIEMNTVPHLQLVQAIERAIIECQPDVVITHHPSDTNNDHLQTSLACQEAIRIHQRRSDVKRINEVWYMEVPSCSEWAINSAFQKFIPNCYVEVGEDGVDAKLKALGMYRGVMRPYPHPRSTEYIKGLAAIRGGEWGLKYAEAFQIVLRRYV